MRLEDIRGVIFDIQRFSIHDGPGIRTNVFLKGCNLSCVWCHNPESKDGSPEMAYYPSKCLSCGACFAACPNGRHGFKDGVGHLFERDGCNRCSVCAEACVCGALSVIGSEVSAGEVIARVKRDTEFFENSGGGMTITGGEPFYQPKFSLALLELAKTDGIHTCVETCGFIGFDVLKKAAEVTDIFLYDIKETSPHLHKEYTGQSNELIIENLEKLNSMGCHIILRCPIIPGLNDRDEHFRQIGALAQRLEGVERVDIEPYHPLGISKAQAIGKSAEHIDETIPNRELALQWADRTQSYTDKQVFIS